MAPLRVAIVLLVASCFLAPPASASRTMTYPYVASADGITCVYGLGVCILVKPGESEIRVHVGDDVSDVVQYAVVFTRGAAWSTPFAYYCGDMTLGIPDGTTEVLIGVDLSGACGGPGTTGTLTATIS